MNKWEVFVDDLSELDGDEAMELTVRTLNDGKSKYTYKRVSAQVSAEQDRYDDYLQVRFGRGQLADQKFSISILNEIQRIPDKYL